jgi:predicted transcriptional regulator
MVTHYLKLLTENGSLEYDELYKTYRITEAGLRVLELHNKIIEMPQIKPGKSNAFDPVVIDLTGK